MISMLNLNTKSNYIIPVMGPTGAGKSTFINQLLGAEIVEIGHSLDSCTIDLKPVEISADMIQQNLPGWKSVNPNLIIVDTPGFGNASAKDIDILNRLADWLKKSYGVGARLAGIIFLQDISNRRVIGISKFNFESLEKLCGVSDCQSIVLGTTQWTRIPDDEREIAATRERELRNNLWKDMISKGSKMRRVDDKNTNTSPWDLVRTVLLDSSLLESGSKETR